MDPYEPWISLKNNNNNTWYNDDNFIPANIIRLQCVYGVLDHSDGIKTFQSIVW